MVLNNTNTTVKLYKQINDTILTIIKIYYCVFSWLELKYRVEKIKSKIKQVEDELFLLIFFYEVFN